MTTYWITKYALTVGIKTLECEKAPDEDGYLSKSAEGYSWRKSWQDQFHFYGRKDWHASEPEAKVRAEEMREAKISSLKKQITKLDKMKF